MNNLGQDIVPKEKIESAITAYLANPSSSIKIFIGIRYIDVNTAVSSYIHYSGYKTISNIDKNEKIKLITDAILSAELISIYENC